MQPQKASEILSINLKEADRKMPPDVKDALTEAIKALRFANIFIEAYHLHATQPQPTTSPQPGQAAAADRAITTE